jgi:PAS domain S-box-containing protein
MNEYFPIVETFMTDPDNIKQDATRQSGKQAQPLDPEELRRHAEETIRHTESLIMEQLSPKETQKMLHELHVHQIELEMQNEELRRSQVKLEEAQARYYDLFNLAPVGYCTVSEKGLILEANLTAANMLGASWNELNKQPLTSFINTEDKDVFYLHNKKLLETSAPQEFDLRMRKKDSTTFWAKLDAALAHDASGAPVLRIVVSDITSRKQAEEALLRSAAHFKLLTETAEQLIMWKNVQVVMETLSKKAMLHLGCDVFFNYTVDLKSGRLHLNAYAGITEEEAGKIEWLDHGEAVSGCVVRDQIPIIAENISATPDPRTNLVRDFGIEAYASWPMIVQNMVTGTLCFGSRTRTSFSKEDLTLMKALTAHMATAMQRNVLVDEIRVSRDFMENKVKERTAELENMIEALRQSNLELEDFSHVASHDLQEPLRKIITFAERLIAGRETSLSDHERDYLARMNQAAARMRSLVSELVKYSQVTADHNAFNSITLKRPVDDAIKDLSVLLDESEGHVDIGELPDVEANETQMRQLFMNLIGNALKYRSEQNPLIRVYCNSSTDNLFHEIYVQDNGIGFDEMFLDKIFKPFQRLHGRTSPYQGTGMGLAICRKIVEHHGGSITAKSEPGKGSTFMVRLPKAASTEA